MINLVACDQMNVFIAPGKKVPYEAPGTNELAALPTFVSMSHM